MKKQTLEGCQDQIIAALSHLQERGFDRNSLLKMTLEAMMRAERDGLPHENRRVRKA